jgi:hypothetical protein
MLDRYLSDKSDSWPWHCLSDQLDGHERILAKQRQMCEEVAEVLGHLWEESSRPEICCIDNQFLLEAQTAKDDNPLCLDPYTVCDNGQVNDDAEMVSLQDRLDIAVTLAEYQEIHGDLAPQTLKKRFELAKAVERSGDHEEAEYHCRRILVRYPQIEVLTFLGMILANASRLEDATSLLFCALTEYISQFSLFSIEVNSMFFTPIEELYTELVCRDDDHDWSPLTSCLIDMMMTIREGISEDTIDQIPSQLFLCGFSSAAFPLHMNAPFSVSSVQQRPSTKGYLKIPVLN